MSDLSGSSGRAGLGSGVCGAGGDPSEAEQRSTREQTERWAAAVGDEIARISQIATLPDAQAESADAPTSCWREGAGDLTRGPEAGGSSSAVRELEGSGDAASERLTLSVDGGDLGALSLVVNRKQGAISVTIGVRDASAEAALGLERHALEQALIGQGITLNSLRIVRADGLGTVLAPPRSTPNQRIRSGAQQLPNENEKRRLARKLNLIG